MYLSLSGVPFTALLLVTLSPIMPLGRGATIISVEFLYISSLETICINQSSLKDFYLMCN